MRDEPELAPANAALTAGALLIRPLPHLRGLILEGEADANSCRALRDALRGITAGDPPEIHLELMGLGFIDVSCTREIMAVTRRPPAERVILHHPPRVLRRIVTFGWPDVSTEAAGEIVIVGRF